MLRALLLIEDYGEMVFLQTLLKKVGYDVLGAQATRGLDDKVLSFNPDVLVASISGKKIDGFKESAALREKNPRLRVILVGGESKISQLRGQGEDSHVDDWLTSPVTPPELLKMISQFSSEGESSVLDKYEKLRTKHLDHIGDSTVISSKGDEKSDLVHVRGKFSAAEEVTHFDENEELTESQASLKREASLFEEPTELDESQLSESQKALLSEAREREKEEELDSEGSLGHFQPGETETTKKNKVSPKLEAWAGREAKKTEESGELQYGQAPQKKSKRELHYENYVKDIVLPPLKTFDQSKVRKIHKQIRQDEGLNVDGPLEEERQSFVKALFRKGS